MKVSTKGRYALRLMVELAVNYDKGYTTIKSVSKNQEISEKYLEQIITILNKSGFVKSIRGPQGGYKLSKEPKEYTVGMILRAVEGSLAPVYCVEDCEHKCGRMDVCSTVYVWQKIKEAVDGVVDNITLEDLCNRNKVI